MPGTNESLKQRIIRNLDAFPDSALNETLDFIDFLIHKHKFKKPPISLNTLSGIMERNIERWRNQVHFRDNTKTLHDELIAKMIASRRDSNNLIEENNIQIWSSRFSTNIELVDLQHQKLFELLNQLSDSFKQGLPSEAIVNETLQELMDYADKHFVDEELLMLTSKLDPRHFNIHRMEHRSFLYDIKNMGDRLSTEEDFLNVSEKLVCFITSWLTFHILGIDQAMAAQINAIKHGATPEQAYDSLRSVVYDTAVTHIMLDSAMELWHMSLDRCHKLEEELTSLHEVTKGRWHK